MGASGLQMTIQKPAPMHLAKPDSRHPEHQAHHQHLVSIPKQIINDVHVECASGIH
jgi:hypothetical protein